MRIRVRFLLSALLAAVTSVRAEDGQLKLLISVETPVIVAPYPARLTLHLHNAGRETVWLYRRVRGQATNGAALEAHLDPAEATAPSDDATPAQGKVFENVGLPRPTLVRLSPDDDTTERTVLDIIPAHSGPERKEIWGRYRLWVNYRAKFSNADEIRRNLGAILWQGEATSNAIEIELQPPAGKGSISGTVQSHDGRLLRDVLVSLSDGEDRLVSQISTDSQGRYSLAQLPFGTYWVTVRRPDFDEDTVVFRHLDVSSNTPEATLDFVLSRPEIYEAARLLHKPALFFVTDAAGRPLEKVSMEITWSNGTVLENVRSETAGDGIASVELIPGRSFVTLKRRGCPKQEDRADVATGGGVDGFKLIYECAQK